MFILFTITSWLMPLTLFCVSVASLVAAIRVRTMTSVLFLIAAFSLSISIGLRSLAYGAMVDEVHSVVGGVQIIPNYPILLTSSICMVTALVAAIVGSIVFVLSGPKQ